MAVVTQLHRACSPLTGHPRHLPAGQSLQMLEVDVDLVEDNNLAGLHSATQLLGAFGI